MRLTTLFLITAFAASTVSADSVLQSSSGDADSGESHDLTIYNSSDEGVYIWVARPHADMSTPTEGNLWGCFDEESPCWSGYVSAGGFVNFSEPTFLDTALYICEGMGPLSPNCISYAAPINIYATTGSSSSQTPPGSLNITVQGHPSDESLDVDGLAVAFTSGSWSHSLRWWGGFDGSDCGNGFSPGGCVAGELHFNGATSSALTDPEVPEPTTLLLALLAMTVPLRVRHG
jgi:hypothetical protein